MKSFYDDYKQNGFCKLIDIINKDDLNDLLESMKNMAVLLAEKNSIQIDSTDHNYILNKLIPKIYEHDKKIGSILYDTMNHHVNMYKVFNNKKLQNSIKKALDIETDSLLCDNFQFFIHVPNEDTQILGWHQDSSYFKQFKDEKSLVCWIPLIDVSKEDGAIWAVSSSHKKGYIEHTNNEIGKHKDVEWNKKGLSYLDTKYFDEKEAAQIEIDFGEVALFDFNLIHKSGLTRGSKVRYTVLARFSSSI